MAANVVEHQFPFRRLPLINLHPYPEKTTLQMNFSERDFTQSYQHEAFNNIHNLPNLERVETQSDDTNSCNDRQLHISRWKSFFNEIKQRNVNIVDLELDVDTTNIMMPQVLDTIKSIGITKLSIDFDADSPMTDRNLRKLMR